MTTTFRGSAAEIEAMFSSEDACVAHLRRLRWPAGFRCPRCDGRKAWQLRSRPLDECASCGHQVSLTAGTVFHRTRTPLRVWFRVIAHVLTTKTGCSALSIARRFDVKYETAWTWLHKLRSCMWQLGRDPLGGIVEVDETLVGGAEDARHKGRSTAGKKALVAAIVEHSDRQMGRIRLAHVASGQERHLGPLVRDNVRPRSVVRTDGHRGYNSVARMDFSHERVFLFGDELAAKALPLVHRLFALLKRQLLGTFQGAVSKKHLQRYLDEFVFRFNRRNATNPWLLVERLLERYVQRAPTYDDLVAPELLPLVVT